MTAIKFGDFSSTQEQLLCGALLLVKERVHKEPTIFATTQYQETATIAEATHAEEIINLTLSSRTIDAAHAPFIADALRYVVWCVETWVDSRPDGQTEIDAHSEFGRKHGMQMSPARLTILKCLARSICPHAEIHTTKRVTTLPSDYHLAECLLALNKATECLKERKIQWGQNNMGIVVDGVLYDFCVVHPLVSQVRDLIERYEG